ncbi:MAG: hypothetical protein ACRESV_01630 [Nevskiales bacterium]
MQPHALVTLHGMPVEITLAWPFHRSISGADFYVLHGSVQLKDGGTLKAEVSAHLTLTIAQALPSLEPADCEYLVLNAVRKTIDNGQLEFLESAKLQPVEVSSRYYSFLDKHVRFLAQPEEVVLALLRRKAFWLGQKPADPAQPSAGVWIADPCDAQYVSQPPEKLLELAGKLAAEGWIELAGEYALPTDALRGQSAFFQAEVQNGLARSRAHYNPAMLAKKA